MQIISIATQKGGTGKTTTASALAYASADDGKRCLAIDLDPQADLTYMLGADAGKLDAYDFLNGTEGRYVIQTVRPFLDVIPASKNLSAIVSARGSARRLADALEPVKDSYDIIIIDTPPTAGELQYNALMASTGVIIPLEAEASNLRGLVQILDTVHQIQKVNKKLKVKGYLITRYDGRSTLARQMREAVENTSQQSKIPFLGVIRAGISAREASALQKSIFEYAPKSKPALDYMALYQSIK